MDHQDVQLSPSHRRLLGTRAWPLYSTCFLVGLLGLLVAFGTAWATRGSGGVQRLAFSYLVGFAFVLSLVLGAMVFVLIQYVTRAGWSVVVRRPAEALAASVPVLAVLLAPIVVFILLGQGVPYLWAQNFDGAHHGAGHAAVEQSPGVQVVAVANADEQSGGAGQGEAAWPRRKPVYTAEKSVHADLAEVSFADEQAQIAHAVEAKGWWLTPGAFIGRWVIYLLVWSGVGLWCWRLSTRQDQTGDDQLTLRMQSLSAPLLLAVALTLTLAAFDLVMSLDPRWYSTIFGVYYFAGGFLGAIAALILILMGLQRMGLVPDVTTEHYHDLGKLLFAFTFFWGYIAFSQYMLYWYGNLANETFWFDLHGFTTVTGRMTQWTGVGVLLLFGHLLVPFVALLPRWAKRRRPVLAFWALWLLLMHLVDVYWLVMPHFDAYQTMRGVADGLIDIGCVVGVTGIFLGAAVRLAAGHSLVPAHDPRLAESLAFHNA